MRRIVLLVFAMTLGACGSPSEAAATPSPQPLAVVDGSGCATDHVQDLTFSSALTGKLSCSAPAATCTLKRSELFGAIHARSGSASLLVSFFISYRDLGQYQFGPTTNDEIDVDGPARWHSSGGTITVGSVKATTMQGTVDAALDNAQGGGI